MTIVSSGMATALAGLRDALVTVCGGAEDLDAICIDLDRLGRDVARHLQHLNHLAYDEVELELGGSEKPPTGGPVHLLDFSPSARLGPAGRTEGCRSGRSEPP